MEFNVRTTASAHTKLFLRCVKTSMLLTCLTVACSAFAQKTIIDTHAHIMMPGQELALNPEVPAGPEELRRQMKASGVSKAAIFAMAPIGDIEATKEYNDYILKLGAESEDFFPVVSVHPLDGDAALDEVRRVAKNGAVALKLHPFYQRFKLDDPAVAAVVKTAGEDGLVVIFDSITAWEQGATGKFVNLAITNPDTKLVLAHMGGYSFNEMILFSVFAKGSFYKNNVFFDLSAVANMYADSPWSEKLIWTMREIGIDQFMFASDFPIFELDSSRSSLESYGFTDEELEKLFHLNAEAVFNLN